MNKRSRASAALALLALAGCPKRPFTYGPRGEVHDPQELMAALAARSQKLRTLQSEISVSGESAQGSGSTNGLLAVERPNHLKLELDDFFGNPALSLTTDGERLGLYQASNNTFQLGPATPDNLAQVVPVEVPLDEAVGLLFGDPRPLAARPSSFAVDRERYAYSLTFEAGARRERIDLDTETLAPVHVRIDGAFPYEARFTEPEAASGLHLPRHLEIVSPRGKVSISYRRPDLNPTLAPALFAPLAPPGAKVIGAN